jgi:hypothetical protein
VKGRFPLLVVMAVILLTTYNNCGKFPGDAALDGAFTGASSVKLCDNGQSDPQALFAVTYHPFLKTNCAICHSSGPGKGNFANSGLLIAWNDFSQIGFSKISEYAIADSHNPPYSGSHLKPEVDSLKERWVTGQQELSSCDPNYNSRIDTAQLPPRYETSTIEITSQSGGVPALHTWDLSASLNLNGLTDPKLPRTTVLTALCDRQSRL